MAGAGNSLSPQGTSNEQIRRSERCVTPVSAASSSSEEDFTASPLDSYDIINKPYMNSKTSRYHMKGKDPMSILQVDVLPDLENQARAAASSLSKMMLTLNQDLKQASTTTLETVKVYEDCVDSVGSTVDESMRTMYALMAKVEELDKKMEPVYELAKQVQEIKILLESFEALCK